MIATLWFFGTLILWAGGFAYLAWLRAKEYDALAAEVERLDGQRELYAIPGPTAIDAAMVAATPPANCRQRLAAEGKAVAKSSCQACGQFFPKWRECDAALAQEARDEN